MSSIHYVESVKCPHWIYKLPNNRLRADFRCVNCQHYKGNRKKINCKAASYSLSSQIDVRNGTNRIKLSNALWNLQIIAERYNKWSHRGKNQFPKKMHILTEWFLLFSKQFSFFSWQFDMTKVLFCVFLSRRDAAYPNRIG